MVFFMLRKEAKLSKMVKISAKILVNFELPVILSVVKLDIPRSFNSFWTSAMLSICQRKTEKATKNELLCLTQTKINVVVETKVKTPTKVILDRYLLIVT